MVYGIFRKLRIDILQSSENWEELDFFLNGDKIVVFPPKLVYSKVKYLKSKKTQTNQDQNNKKTHFFFFFSPPLNKMEFSQDLSSPNNKAVVIFTNRVLPSLHCLYSYGWWSSFAPCIFFKWPSKHFLSDVLLAPRAATGNVKVFGKRTGQCITLNPHRSAVALVLRGKVRD